MVNINGKSQMWIDWTTNSIRIGCRGFLIQHLLDNNTYMVTTESTEFLFLNMGRPLLLILFVHSFRKIREIEKKAILPSNSKHFELDELKQDELS